MHIIIQQQYLLAYIPNQLLYKRHCSRSRKLPFPIICFPYIENLRGEDNLAIGDKTAEFILSPKCHLLRGSTVFQQNDTHSFQPPWPCSSVETPSHNIMQWTVWIKELPLTSGWANNNSVQDIFFFWKA